MRDLVKQRRTEDVINPTLRPVNRIFSEENFPENEVLAKYKQTDSELVTKYYQSTSDLLAKNPQSTSEVLANCKQTISEVEAKVPAKVLAKIPEEVFQKADYHSASEMQKKILDYFFEIYSLSKNPLTPPVRPSELASLINTSENTLKNAISRMCQKGLLQKNSFKDGRQGWTIYLLNEKVMNQLEEYKKMERKVLAKVPAKVLAEHSSSSSYNNTKHTSTTQKQDSGLGPSLNSNPNLNLATDSDSKGEEDEGFCDEIKKISVPDILNLVFDINTDKKLQILLSKMQKAGIQHGKMNERDAQEYLDWFAFEIQVNNVLNEKKIKNPLAYFLACISKGYSRPYNFKSDEEIAAEEMLRRKKDQLEKIKKFEEEAFNVEFELWTNGLPEAQKRLKMPPDLPCAYMGTFHVAHLKECFREEEWPWIWEKNYRLISRNCSNTNSNMHNQDVLDHKDC